MSSDDANRGFSPPGTAVISDQLHRHQQPSSATNPTGEKTSPTTPKTISYVTFHTNNTTTPESQIAAVLGRAINAIPATSFSDAVTTATTTTTTSTDVNTQNPLRRTVSDASSCDYPQTSTITITTPPKAPETTRSKTPLRRTVSDPVSINHQEPQKTIKVPVARTVFPSIIPRTMPPESCNRKQSPGFKRLRKIEETVRDIEQKCWDVMQECECGVAEEHIVDDNSFQRQETQVKEECVAFERLSDGGLRFQLRCSCGKGFEILIKDNGCFYKLT